MEAPQFAIQASVPRTPVKIRSSSSSVLTRRDALQVLVFPTLIPRDLPHLARGLDLWKLVSCGRTVRS